MSRQPCLDAIEDVLVENDPRTDFEIRRGERIARLHAAAKRALWLARRFASESVRPFRDPAKDHRVIGCVRQVGEYRRAIARLRRMHFNDGADLVLVATMSEELRPTG